jgi:hypothetical protein
MVIFNFDLQNFGSRTFCFGSGMTWHSGEMLKHVGQQQDDDEV